MADRKISELAETSSVASGDVIVVVTGVGVGGATLTTQKLPLSGLMNHVVKIDEIEPVSTDIRPIPENIMITAKILPGTVDGE